ncbi:MAG: hypothetical protein U5J83_06545 [Bryobacterales bacterium]|nr:hypothetical protein [Bryobacterales bacterium]
MQQATRLALERARDLSQTLHPAVLDSHGLVGALERFLPGFERQSGIRVHVPGEGIANPAKQPITCIASFKRH